MLQGCDWDMIESNCYRGVVGILLGVLQECYWDIIGSVTGVWGGMIGSVAGV